MQRDEPRRRVFVQRTSRDRPKREPRAPAHDAIDEPTARKPHGSGTPRSKFRAAPKLSQSAARDGLTGAVLQSDPNAGPYVSVHRFRLSAGPDGYTHHHVMPFVQGPPPPGGELMYAEDPPPAQEAGVPEEEEEGSPPSSAMNGGADIFGKRKQPDSGMSEGSVRKRRQRAPNGGDLDGDGDMHDLDVGPNGGPKHWTEGEKTKFFTWMLTSDDHWDAFRTRMNTVFREVRSVSV